MMNKQALVDVTTYIKRGITPKYVDSNGIIVINQKCIREHRINYELARLTSKEKKITEEKLLKSGDILINSTGTGTLGRTAQIFNVDKDITVDTHVTIVRPSEDIDARYLGYIIRVNESLITSLGKGATNQIELASKDLEKIKINIPSKEIQTKISNILSSYDDLIENNLKRIKLLEESAELIYKEWFVNLRFPGYEKCNIVDGIPEDWTISKVNNICEIKNGYAFKSKDYSKDGIELVRTRDFSDSVFIDRKEDIRIPNNLVEKYEKYLLNDLDFLLIMVGASIGKYGIVLNKDLPSLQNQNMWSIYTKDSDKIPQTYIIGMMKNLINLVLNFRTGAARDFFRKDHLGEREVLVPHSNLLDDYDRISRPIYNQINKLLTQNEKLKEARDILIPRLISGEIEV